MAGLRIETVGGAFAISLLTVSVTELLAVAPALSRTLAVMTWVPAVKVVVTLEPVPIWPLRLEFQTIFALKFPSCVSVADPAN